MPVTQTVTVVNGPGYGRPSRSWCFTLNNPDEVIPTLGTDVRYVTWQHERGGEEDTLHIQGYAEFNRPYRFRAAQRSLGIGQGAHMEPRFGSREQARDYCRKDDTRVPDTEWHELGVWISGRGARTDLAGVADLIHEGATLNTIANDYTEVFIRYPRGIREVHAMLQPIRARPAPVVFVLHGPTGIGKSRLARELYPNAFWWPRSGNQCTYAFGYAGETDCIFDDFNGQIPLAFLMRLIDRYPLSVNTQGSNTPFLASNFVITSNYLPLKIVQ